MGHDNDRYIPRALPGSKSGWQIYDRLKEKFVTAAELKDISVEVLRSEQLPTN